MSLVTSTNVSAHEGWQVSSLGRITRPVKMRPERPLPDIQQEKPKPILRKNQGHGVGTTEGEKKKKNKRLKGPDSRARRRTIDMAKWGSTHLKGMFLDMPALGMKRLKLDDPYDDPTVESEDNEGSGNDNDRLKVSQSSEQTVASQTSLPLPKKPINISADNIPILPIKSQPSAGQVLWPLPDDNIDLEVEKTQYLDLLASLFGCKDDNWVRPESVGSDIDVEELMKGDAMLVDDADDDVEVVPIDNSTKNLQDEEKEDEREMENPLAPGTSTKSTELGVQASTKLKDLFAPREEEGKYFFLSS